MTIPHAARRGAAALAAVLALAGCGVIEVDYSRDSVDSQADGVLTEAEEGAAPETLQNDERQAVGAVDRFWQENFREAFGRDYRSPTIVGPYVGEAGPTCSGTRSVPFNAFYCPSEDFIAWDEQLMAAGYEQVGDAWVWLIIAHEWAHAIQARLQRDQVSRDAELQADCLAGATLGGAARQGILELQAGDTEELAATLRAVADEYPWTDEGDHGDARERTAAFQTGAEDGIGACVA